MFKSAKRVLEDIKRRNEVPDVIISSYMNKLRSTFEKYSTSSITKKIAQLTPWFEALKGFLEMVDMISVSEETVRIITDMEEVWTPFVNEQASEFMVFDLVVSIMLKLEPTSDPEIWTDIMQFFLVVVPPAKDTIGYLLNVLADNAGKVVFGFWWVLVSKVMVSFEYDRDKVISFLEIAVMDSENRRLVNVVDKPRTFLWSAVVLRDGTMKDDKKKKFVEVLFVLFFRKRLREGNGLSTLKCDDWWGIPNVGTRVVECIMNASAEGKEILAELCMWSILSFDSTVRQKGDELRWGMRLRALRSIMKSVYRVSPDNASIVIDMLRGITDPTDRAILGIQVMFDTRMLSLVEIVIDESTKEYLETHLVQVGLVFAPLVWGLEKEDIKEFTIFMRTKNQRLKADGSDVFIEKLPMLFTDPIGFGAIMNYHGNVKMFKPKISKKEPWKHEEVVSYLTAMLRHVGSERSAFGMVVMHLSMIGARVQQHFASGGHELMASLFLDKCLDNAHVYVVFKATTCLLKALSLWSDVSHEQVCRWIGIVKNALSESMFQVEGCEAVEFCVKNFPQEAYVLVELYLDVVAELGDIASRLPFFVSIYVICLCVAPNLEARNRVVAMIRQCIESKALTNEMFNSVVNIMIEAVMNPCVEEIDEAVRDLVTFVFDEKFFDEEVFVTRVVEMFTEYFDLIQRKFPGFFETLWVCFCRLVSIKDISQTMFRVFMNTITDLALRIDNGRTLFLELKQKISDACRDELKRTTINHVSDEFIARYNRAVIDTGALPKPDVCAFTNENAIHVMRLVGSEANIAIKTRKGACVHRLSVPMIKIPYTVDRVIEEQAPEMPIPSHDQVKSNLSTNLARLVEEAGVNGVEKLRANDYMFMGIASDVVCCARALAVLDKDEEEEEEVLEDRLCTELDDSYVASGLYESIFGYDFSSSVMKEGTGGDKSNYSSLFSVRRRESCKIGLLYVAPGENKQGKILSATLPSVSDGFKSFMRSLGDIVDLSVHEGFTAGLSTNAASPNGRYHIYSSNSRFEIMFHTGPLLPTDPRDEQQVYKKRHIGNDNVHIVWSEHWVDYNRLTITSQFNDAHVIVYPLPRTTQLFRVVVYKKNPNWAVGPLAHETIVSAAALPELVRWTAIFGDRVARGANSIYELPSQLFDRAVGGSFRQSKPPSLLPE